jgi:hypothetical protein
MIETKSSSTSAVFDKAIYVSITETRPTDRDTKNENSNPKALKIHSVMPIAGWVLNLFKSINGTAVAKNRTSVSEALKTRILKTLLVL